MKVNIRTMRAVLGAMDNAAGWIALGEEETKRQQISWFTANPKFDRARKALRAAIAAAEARP